MHLLYVEDSDFDCMAFRRLMKKFPDVTYDIARNDSEMAQLLQTNSYHAILRDVYLKGGQSAHNLQETDTPLYFVSGSQAVLNKLITKNVQKEQVFLKPLQPKDILYVINKDRDDSLNSDPNFEILDEWADGDVDFRRDIIQVFLDEIPAQLAKTRQALDERDYTLFAETTHAMLTKFRTFGLTEIISVVEDLEHKARNGSIEYNAAIREIDRVEAALKITTEILNREKLS